MTMISRLKQLTVVRKNKKHLQEPLEPDNQQETQGYKQHSTQEGRGENRASEKGREQKEKQGKSLRVCASNPIIDFFLAIVFAIKQLMFLGMLSFV